MKSLVLFAFIPLVVNGSGLHSLEPRTRVSLEHFTVMHHEDGTVPEFTAFVNHSFKGKVGAFLFGRAERLRSNNHGDAIGGVSYSVAKGVHVGLGAGMNSFPRFNRVGTMVAVERWRTRTFALYENGAGGEWHALAFNYEASRRVGIGFMSETHLGIGPKFEKGFGPVAVWFGYLYEKHTRAYNTVFGITIEHSLPWKGGGQ